MDAIMRMASSDVEDLCHVLNVSENSPRGRSWAAVASLQLWLVYPAALVGIVAAVRDPVGRRAVLIPLVFIAYFVLVSGPEAYARFRVPAMPFVTMLSGVGLSRLYRGASTMPSARL
jgi:hypothetical protein